ncbi:MAG: acyltransferase [Ahniella sp.]|nr:acyltransferase [Ahniella sp.]
MKFPTGMFLNSLFAAGLAMLLFALAGGPNLAARLLQNWPLRALGVVSYGVYLWHVPAMMAIRHWADPSWPGVFRQMAAFGLTMLLAGLSWVLIERPILRWSRSADRGHQSPARSP